MSRALWKGVLGFGLLRSPVSLHPAIQQDEIDFDWLQRDTLQPVGYKRVVKETGEEVGKDDVVKAVKQDDGSYVALSDEEIRAANVEATQSIDILAFVDGRELSFVYFETPYFLAPGEGGEKAYALLREALLASGKVGIALIVLHNKQHLAALIPTPQALYLNMLRWATEIRHPDDLPLPAEGAKAAGVKPRELRMAADLIEAMSENWNPARYKDTFRDDIMALVKKKRAEGHATQVSEEAPPSETPQEEIDIAEMLKRSLHGKPGAIIHGRLSAAFSHQAPRGVQRKNGRASKTLH